MDKKAKIATITTLILIGILAIGLVLAAPPKSKGKPQCKDGKDNDGDGLIDYPADPGCSSSEDRDEYNAPVIYCGDNICNGDETCATCQGDCGFCDSCSDTDGGIVATIQGIVSSYFNGQSYNYADYCQINGTLVEYYCNGDYAQGTLINCVNATICSNGACV